MNNLYELNSSCLSNEMKLILCLAKEDNMDNYNQELEIKIDWGHFLHLVRHHRIYPAIYHRLRAQMVEWIPNHVVNSLNRDYECNTFRMLYLSAEMDNLANEFSGNQIKAIFLKGPILADVLYGDVSLRTSGDLDILIPIKDLEKVGQLLIQNGYVKDDYIHTILDDWKWRHHHVTYYHLQKKSKVEIHWRLNPGPAKEPSFNELWKRKRTSKLTSTPIFTLGKEDLFLFLILHGARHGWSRLRWLVDIKQLINQQPDWVKVIKLLRKFQCLHVAGQAIILASELLSAPLPEKMSKVTNAGKAKHLAQDVMFYLNQMVNLHSNPVPDDIAQYHKRYLFSIMHLKQKLLFILSFLFPYPEDAETLPLPKPFHFLYFPLRPFIWSWRKMRNEGPGESKR